MKELPEYSAHLLEVIDHGHEFVKERLGLNIHELHTHVVAYRHRMESEGATNDELLFFNIGYSQAAIALTPFIGNEKYLSDIEREVIDNYLQVFRSSNIHIFRATNG